MIIIMYHILVKLHSEWVGEVGCFSNLILWESSAFEFSDVGCGKIRYHKYISKDVKYWLT